MSEESAVVNEIDGAEDYIVQTQTFFQNIENFHTKFGLAYKDKPRELDEELGLFRIGFMIEELAEYAAHSGYVNLARSLNEMHDHIKQKARWVVKRNEGGRDIEMQFDSLIDLVYVAMGTAHMHGFDFDEGWRRVHEANMAKVRVERIEDSQRSSKYDVIKPKGWKPASLADLVVS